MDLQKSNSPAPADHVEMKGDASDSTASPKKPILYERLLGDKPAPVRWFVNFLCICALLYLFLVGLDLMGNAFKAMSGKGVGNMMGSIDNPIAGVALGIIVTVLLQSSSTSTSIVVTMVGADIITVTNAIPIIMGANIGTSVTAAIVSHGHIGNLEEFHRGFAGANVHSAFNLMTVVLLLPIELITAAISGGNGLLGMIAEALGDAFVGANADTFKSPVKILVGPLTQEFIKIDKDLIKTIAKGCISCNSTHVEPMFCKAEKKLDDGEKLKFCMSGEDWTQKYQEDGRVIKSGFSKDLGDEGGAVLILFISLVFLCIALYYIVKLLHFLVLSSGRAESKGDETETKFVRVTRKILRFNGCVSILFGMVMTIAVQSSSIVTSTLTPVVALGIISVEDMLPLTLGANIGTTCTAFLAAIVTEKKNAIMISICHLFFNIFGIAIFYPTKFMRSIPIKAAYKVGDHVLKYRWFGPFYICLVFVVVPLLLFLFSLTLDLGVGGIIFNVIFDTALIIGTIALIARLDRVVNFITAFRSGKDTAAPEEPPQASA